MRGHFCVFSCAALLGFSAAGQSNQPAASPIQQRITAAQARISQQPKAPDGYNDLALAYVRWARDRPEPQLYGQAEGALKQSLQASPGNLQARRLQVMVLLGEGQAEQALKLAASLQEHNHDDISVWALLADANMALGNMTEAERDAQWVLDLRSGSSLGFTTAAELRERTGDAEGAVEFYEEALRRTSPSDVDERSWLLTQEARLQAKLGNDVAAERLAKQALQLFPESHLANHVLAGLPHQDVSR